MPVIPLYAPSVGELEATNLAECIRQNLLIHGPFVAEFERGIAEFVGTAHAVGTRTKTIDLTKTYFVTGQASKAESYAPGVSPPTRT